MTMLLTGPIQSISLPEPETALARTSSDALSQFSISDNQPLTLRLENSRTGQQLEATIPAVAVRVFAEALAKLADGQPVAVMPLHAELSTQQAADLLGVSRPYFIKLLERGKMPFRKVGAQRRVQYRDLLHYINEYQTAASAALEEMTAEAERMGLYE